VSGALGALLGLVDGDDVPLPGNVHGDALDDEATGLAVPATNEDIVELCVPRYQPDFLDRGRDDKPERGFPNDLFAGVAVEVETRLVDGDDGLARAGRWIREPVEQDHKGSPRELQGDVPHERRGDTKTQAVTIDFVQGDDQARSCVVAPAYSVRLQMSAGDLVADEFRAGSNNICDLSRGKLPLHWGLIWGLACYVYAVDCSVSRQ